MAYYMRKLLLDLTEAISEAKLFCICGKMIITRNAASNRLAYDEKVAIESAQQVIIFDDVSYEPDETEIRHIS